MTLLEKLNLEPDAVCSEHRRSAILKSFNLSDSRLAGLSWWAYGSTPVNLSNEEFLTACEAWLANN